MDKYQWFESDKNRIAELLDCDPIELSGKRAHGMLSEFCDGDLTGYIKENPDLSPKKLCELMYDAAEGLEVMHRLGMSHRDIKPDNIFIKYGRGKIGDLGLAVYLDEFTGDICGTPSFMAPETDLSAMFSDAGLLEKCSSILGFVVMRYCPFWLSSVLPLNDSKIRDTAAPAVDIYALGKTFQTITNGREIDFHKAEDLTTEQIQGCKMLVSHLRKEHGYCMWDRKRGVLTLGAHLKAAWPVLQDLATKMMTEDPKARPSATEVKEELKKIISSEALKIRITSP